MPVYTFENRNTQKHQTIEMKIAELDVFLKAHPELQQIFLTFPGMVSPYSVGRLKTDSKFRDRMNLIKTEMPGNKVRTDNLTEV